MSCKLKGIAMMKIIFILIITSVFSNLSFSVVVTDEGKIAMEDGDPDGDWNDVVFTYTGEVHYKTVAGASTDLISNYDLSVTGTRCTAMYQDAVYFRPQCNGTVIIENPNDNEIYNGEANKGEWLKVVDAFCRDMFEGGSVGVYQNDYDSGLTFDLTVVCDESDVTSGYVTPDTNDAGGLVFPAVSLFGVDPDGIGPKAILSSDSSMLRTTSWYAPLFDKNISNINMDIFLKALIHPMLNDAYAGTSAIPMVMNVSVDTLLPNDREDIVVAYNLGEKVTNDQPETISEKTFRENTKASCSSGEVNATCLKNIVKLLKRNMSFTKTLRETSSPPPSIMNKFRLPPTSAQTGKKWRPPPKVAKTFSGASPKWMIKEVIVNNTLVKRFTRGSSNTKRCRHSNFVELKNCVDLLGADELNSILPPLVSLIDQQKSRVKTINSVCAHSNNGTLRHVRTNGTNELEVCENNTWIKVGSF